ncbi:MAG: pitrilysin family protein [Streptococcus hyointestinalis]|uniref:EF-P 5-aminopentanol modification-associated protein YfmF n=1 Tax=Streptococcus hyointestinalis TaxID=1337 RepID=UPI0023F0C298|nr:pitrilysin family protein [Streptococcus hyointestinalis]MCI6872065.1 insulinase family protein [Streptococcus hyointestinalis]MDD6384175.1 pitrilysin family protein [Streptococcus hyointestinalis]MDD7357207.1 pitrilysin family protein [Streptococcus hyointestinalis]MDY4553984.1 pitrilysin family protein [Streptococcus hyointestinalis]
MKLAEGVNLHFIKKPGYKMNHITFRFSGAHLEKTVTRRVLVAQMLATATKKYPTSLEFRKKLASLYGASLSTNVSTIGKTHRVDIEISFMRDAYTFHKEPLLESIVNVLKEVLYAPLVSSLQYNQKVFSLEKNNLKRYLEAEEEDIFYSSQLDLQRLYYQDDDLKASPYGELSNIEAETPYSAYQEFQRMLQQDCIDIFVVGEVDDYRVIQLLSQLPFDDRSNDVVLKHQQPIQNTVNVVTNRRQVQQSVLQLGYRCQVNQSKEDNLALAVLSGMLGNFSHSLLFTDVRERLGITYNIGCQLDVYTGLLNIYAGIDKKNRRQVLNAINKQLFKLKFGRFSNELLEQTKSLLKTTKLMMTDKVSYNVEEVYLNEHLGSRLSLEEWLTELDKVSKEDISRIARYIKLQSLYFIEGRD